MTTETCFLIRQQSHAQGTEGILLTPHGFSCKTMELPWRNNEQNISCINEGTYLCVVYFSNKFGKSYHVTDVDGRTWILCHTGNLAGDKSLGYKTHSAGCILLGKYHGFIEKQRAVLCSRPTVKRFMEVMEGQDFNLVVTNNIAIKSII